MRRARRRTAPPATSPAVPLAGPLGASGQEHLEAVSDAGGLQRGHGVGVGEREAYVQAGDGGGGGGSGLHPPCLASSPGPSTLPRKGGKGVTAASSWEKR